MPDITLINSFLQRELRRRGKGEVAAVEAASWLDHAGILKDSPARPGKPLRDRLRAGEIRGQRQELNGRWFIELLTSSGENLRGRHRTPRGQPTEITEKHRLSGEPIVEEAERYEGLRELYRPERIGTATQALLIGESRPANGTFFYCANSKLFRHTQEAFAGAYGAGVRTDQEFLEQFQRNGFFLADLCAEPVNHLKDELRPKRLAIRQAGQSGIATELSLLPKGTKIVVVMKDIIANVSVALAIAGRSDLGLDLELPFPSRPEHTQRYVSQMANFLRINCRFQA